MKLCPGYGKAHRLLVTIVLQFVDSIIIYVSRRAYSKEPTRDWGKRNNVSSQHKAILEVLNGMYLLEGSLRYPVCQTWICWQTYESLSKDQSDIEARELSVALLSMCKGSLIPKDQKEVEARELWIALLPYVYGKSYSKGPKRGWGKRTVSVALLSMCMGSLISKGQSSA